MHVAVCRLTLHENLFYATREIGRLYETGRYLHNYGLTYALGLATAPYFHVAAVPNYRAELTPLNERGVYITPARPKAVRFELNTFKYADNRYRVKMEQGSRNTPSFGRAKEVAVGSEFEFAVMSFQPCNLPRWIRLGKWFTKAKLDILQSEEVTQVDRGEFVAGFPINPLDLAETCQIHTYDLITMPPVSVLDNVLLSGEFYRLADGRCVPCTLMYRFPD